MHLVPVRYLTDPPHYTGVAIASCCLSPAGSAAKHRHLMHPALAHNLTAVNMVSFFADRWPRGYTRLPQTHTPLLDYSDYNNPSTLTVSTLSPSAQFHPAALP